MLADAPQMFAAAEGRPDASRVSPERTQKSRASPTVPCGSATIPKLRVDIVGDNRSGANKASSVLTALEPANYIVEIVDAPRGFVDVSTIWAHHRRPDYDADGGIRRQQTSPRSQATKYDHLDLHPSNERPRHHITHHGASLEARASPSRYVHTTCTSAPSVDADAHRASDQLDRDHQPGVPILAHQSSPDALARPVVTTSIIPIHLLKFVQSRPV